MMGFNFDDYKALLGGFNREGATKRERRAYDLGVRDSDMNLVEWRPYSDLPAEFLIDKYENSTKANFLYLSVELMAFAALFYFMRPFFWALVVCTGIYFIYIYINPSIRTDKLRRELIIRNKGKW